MREYLTIGELSRMLGISAHSIRYYEKEGLIASSHVSDSGYRLYDYEELYILSAVKILRDSDIPIKRIRKLFNNYSKEDYIAELKRSQKKVTAQIARLEALKQQLGDSIALMTHIQTGLPVFSYHELPRRRLKIIKRSNHNIGCSIKELYDAYIRHNVDMSRLYREDTIYYLLDDAVCHCVLDNDDIYDPDTVVCDAGRYLCYTFYENIEGTAEQQIDTFYAYIKENGLHTQGGLLLIVRTQASMASETSLITELQIRIIS